MHNLYGKKQIEIIKQKVRRFSPEIFKEYPVRFAYLYGSYATGYVHPFSDLDIGIFTEEMSVRKAMKLELILALEMEEIIGSGLECEVRVINELPLLIKGQIVTEGCLIYSRDNALRVDFETSVRSAYFDFLPYIRSFERQYE